ncbi:elongation factor Ts, mitochondrial-like [Daphnia magna]|uniref:Uncharacterized protein n=2 Tax=Daphnia magna TaxID=35525 RepID=A0ABQ9ZKL8_9CRUS|nr:elongation factor Ts, mitochondrial-like [Daphnia magna]KAK4013461.1 hypothetical protein OUZ56_026016 [Daphnia magna]KZS13312.1 Elongation factor Ts, mitochondrial [Daphnia magna]CAG4639561.1 EOG090X0EI4 [Daphnia magna]
MLRRLFHRSSNISFRTSEMMPASQSLLSTLRKKTGYAITNCKKALEMNDNDIEKAENWLHAQAQSQGWAKAAKLQNRSTPNGLVGIMLNKKCAAMVEVNCETDFVSKNEKFQSVVTQTTGVCFKKSLETVLSSDVLQETPIIRLGFSSEQLGALQLNNKSDSKLSDFLALNIGLIGENMAVRRGAALCSTNSNIKFASSTHPEQVLDGSSLGKYAAVIAYEEGQVLSEQAELIEIIEIEKLPKQLCQHIIGMNPQSLEKEDNSSDEEETALYHQEFLAHPDYTVREVLDHVGWKIKAFLRFECGETVC